MCAANFEIFQKSSETVICKIELNPSPPDPRWRENINLIFIFALLCGASKSLKALKAFTKPYEVPKKSVNII